MDSGAGRAQARIAELARRQCDLATFWREASEVLGGAVPHYWVPCWYTLDPASHLITSHFHEGLEDYPDEWLDAEYLDDDVNQIRDVIGSESGISTLHDLTGGDPSGTPRWQANIELGGDQELLLRLRTGSGETWGALGLYRELGKPMFDPVEKRFLVEVSTALAEGARRALVYGEATEPDWPDGPGLVMVAADGEVESMTEAARVQLTALAGGDLDAGLPLAVLTVARAAAGGEPTETRVRVPDGPWLTLSAARLLGRHDVAVVVQRARPARIFDLVMSANGLTERERDVVGLVLRGASTSGIAAGLRVTPYTVQEHLKSVFDKMGVRSRRELVAQAFFTHYAPRFRDNERRVGAGLAMRGNPAPPGPSSASEMVAPFLYQSVGPAAPTGMRTLQLYAESAIKRDLARARTVLHGGARLGPERRYALVDHLTWLMSLVQPGTTGVSPAAAAVRDGANAFRREGFGAERETVLQSLEALERVVSSLHGWTSPDVVRVALGNLPWVLDAVDPRGGPGLVLPSSEPPDVVRLRTAEYRRRRVLLWGPVALHPPRLLKQVTSARAAR